MDTRAGDTDPTDSQPPSPPPSARVRLEVDILASEPGMARLPTSPIRDDTSRVVIVVSADGDVRRYIRESLRDQVDVRVLEVATIDDARRVAWHTRASLVITDIPEALGSAALRSAPAILITDDSRDGAAPDTECVALPRPFTAETLAAVVVRLLG